MTRVFIILFCLNLFSGGRLWSEISRIPALAKHYVEHKAEKADLSLVEFLWLHYVDAAHPTDPSHNHHSLPFHTHCGHSGIHMAFELAIDDNTSQPLAPVESAAFTAANFYYNQYLPSGYQSRFFQPPKA
jgi:hypothetical protein